jgi:hypothetical protein
MADRDVRLITKRTSVSGKIPTGTTGTELNFIKQGELASNLSDKKLFSYDGSNVFEFGSSSFFSLTGGTISGNTRVTGNLSAGTIYSGSTNLYDIFIPNGFPISASTIQNVNYIDFNTGATVTSQVGRLNWNDADEIGGLEVGMKGGNVTLQIGEENLARVYNDDTITLTDGMIVYVTGNQGNTISVQRASATAETTSARVLGVVTESIAVGERGYVNTFGLVNKLNTIAYSGGSPIYLGITSGTFTDVKPEAPNHICQIGFISRSHASTGSLFVHISNGWELDELHDVLVTGLTNLDILQYNSSQQVWKNTNSPTFNSMSAGTLSGGTLLSGSTNLYDIFQPINKSPYRTFILTAGTSFNFTGTVNTVSINKTTGSATQVNLPSSPSINDFFVVKDRKGDSNSNPITVSGGTNTIDGSTSYIIKIKDKPSLTFLFDGSEYIVI